jgi:hypothetical protein
MKMKSFLMLAVFLVAAATALQAQELKITPSGPVQAGTILHFSAYLKYGEAVCEEPWGPKVIHWFVSNESGVSWQTESVIPANNAGWNWYNFNKTYTVTAADIDDPKFCFTLYSGSGCWGTNWPSMNTTTCPPTKLVIPNFHLQNYFECSVVPGCPRCVMLDLAWLIRSIGDPLEGLQVVLLRNGQQFALLGEAGHGRKLPAQVRITLPAAGRGVATLRQEAGFQLRILGKRGQVLASEEVTLRIK